MALPLSYRSFLVRLWRASPDGPWRGEVESIQSGELVEVESLEQALAILQRAARDDQPPAPSPRKSISEWTDTEGAY